MVHNDPGVTRSTACKKRYLYRALPTSLNGESTATGLVSTTRVNVSEPLTALVKDPVPYKRTHFRGHQLMEGLGSPRVENHVKVAADASNGC
jgi:hypothetical protein